MKRIFLVLGIVIGIGLLGWFIFHLIHKPQSSSVINFTIPTPTPDPLAPKNILLMGYGGGMHDGGLLTDTMIVAHIIPKQQLIILISVPRDLWVTLPITSSGLNSKINAAFAYGSDTTAYTDRPANFTGINGGGALAEYAVTQVIGLSMDGYAAVSFDGFKSVLMFRLVLLIRIILSMEKKKMHVEQQKKNKNSGLPHYQGIF
jgi:anionic cell wall polymer biosynthesis LytR-Cps2A-Psr (LCP) family protein